jgi:hypothetical protein
MAMHSSGGGDQFDEAVTENETASHVFRVTSS